MIRRWPGELWAAADRVKGRSWTTGLNNGSQRTFIYCSVLVARPIPSFRSLLMVGSQTIFQRRGSGAPERVWPVCDVERGYKREEDKCLFQHYRNRIFQMMHTSWQHLSHDNRLPHRSDLVVHGLITDLLSDPYDYWYIHMCVFVCACVCVCIYIHTIQLSSR